jgi:transposase InsO family protein
MVSGGSRTPTSEEHHGRSPSHRPQGGRGGGERLVVERVVEKVASAGPVNYPLLTKTNYNDWALLMKIKMEARLLWAAVDPGDVDFQVDRMALDAICSAVPPEMISTLATKPSAREAWESVKTMRIGGDRVRKVSSQKLWREYEQLAFRDGESVEDFSMRLTNLTNQLATLGDAEPDDKIVAKYLRVARPRYRQLIVSIETLLDITTLSVEEVTAWLKAVKDDEGPAGNRDGGDKLYLNEEEWLKRYNQKEPQGSRRDAISDSGGRSGPPGTRGKDKCRSYGKIRHWARECRSPRKREEQAHVVEDDEPTLMLAQTETFSSPNLGQPSAAVAQLWLVVTSSAPKRSVELVEEEVYAVLGDAGEGDPKRWIFDMGASNHMTGIAELDFGVVGTVRFGDGSVVRIEGCDTILFACKNGEHRTLVSVYYIPRLTANIVSCGQLDEDGFQIHIERGVMRIRDEKKRLLAKIRRSAGRLYVLDITIARAVCLAACAGEDAWRWHARFGHINFDALRKMGREGLVRDLPILSQVDQICEACLAGKHRRTPFPHQALRRATEPLELVHGDLCGPITPATPSGNRYFLLLVDDYSRFMWVMLLPTKDGAPAAIKNVQAAAERKSGKKLRILRTDRGGEFTANHFKKYFEELGMQRQLTAPYSPPQNGVIEQRNQTVVGAARNMLKAKDLPGTFWGEAVMSVVYVLNRSSSKGASGRTPYELWTGSTPSVHHLRTFGCVAHVKNTRPHLQKLEDRSKPMINGLPRV